MKKFLCATLSALLLAAPVIAADLSADGAAPFDGFDDLEFFAAESSEENSMTVTEPNGLATFYSTLSFTPKYYSDVNTEDWFYDAVHTVTRAGFMRGVGDNRFSPNREITVAELCTLAARIHSTLLTDTPDAADHYGDEIEYTWSDGYVKYCLHNGISNGIPRYVQSPATRLECAAYISRAIPANVYPEINAVVEGSIPDLPYNADDDSAHVYRLYRMGVLNGVDSSGAFHPDRPIYRSEIAAIVARLVDPAQLRTVIGMTHTLEQENGTPLAADKAKELLETALTQAYEHTYGEFVPLDEKPETPVSDAEYLRWAIPHLPEPAETEYGYQFEVIFPFFVDRYSGAVCKVYNGLNSTMTVFDPLSSDALAFAG